MKRLVLVRHGQSQWNLENRFTGWVDVPLTVKGQEEAKKAGQILRKSRFQFERAYTSCLKRAIHTLWLILCECDQSWIPVVKDWRLNERHYGALQGLDKSEIKKKHGEEQVFKWRRSYDTLPPVIRDSLQEDQLKDRRYQGMDKNQFPKAEALKHTLDRVSPYWDQIILPKISQAATGSMDFLIVAHGNSLRALIKHLTDMDGREITAFEFPTGLPLVCELDHHFKIANMEWTDP